MDATAPAVVAAVPALNTDQPPGWFTTPREPAAPAPGFPVTGADG
jgi:hypothetical protein